MANFSFLSFPEISERHKKQMEKFNEINEEEIKEKLIEDSIKHEERIGRLLDVLHRNKIITFSTKSYIERGLE